MINIWLTDGATTSGHGPGTPPPFAEEPLTPVLRVSHLATPDGYSKRASR